MEDDHVDRTGVEAQQCVKLTVTNSSIDFFVPIVHVHQAKLDDIIFCLHGPRALQTARATGILLDSKNRKARRTSVLYGCLAQPRARQANGPVKERRVKLNRASALQLLENCFHLKNGNRCVLPTWWLSRGGCTRSLSEHGRETPQRQWYFVSRRGRVGRCQVCKTQHKIFSITKMGNKPKSKGRQKRPLCYNKSFRGVEQPGSSSGS